MVKDDVRWRNIARGVARFKPSINTDIPDSIAQTSGIKDNDYLQKAPGLSSSELCCTGLSTGKLKATELQELKQGRDARTKRRLNKAFDRDFESGDSKRAKRSATGRIDGASVLTTLQHCLRSSKHFRGTPLPQIVPEAKVLVPFTKSPKVQRAFPNPTNIDNATTAPIELSSSGPLLRSMVTETSFVEVTASLNFPSSQPQPPTSGKYVEAQSYPGISDQMLHPEEQKQASTDTSNVTLRLSQTSLPESRIMIGTERAEPVEESVKFSGEEKLSSQSSKVASTTQTPSPMSHIFHDISPLAHKSRTIPTHVIDLTSDTGPPSQRPSRRCVLGLNSSPADHVATPKSPATKIVPPQRLLEKLRALPQRIESPIPTKHLDDGMKESFLTIHLADLADKFDLSNLFQPLNYPTRLNNSERGYWKMSLKITDLGTVARLRRQPLTASQWSDKRFMLRQEGRISPDLSTPDRDAALQGLAYPPKDPNSAIPWTVDEFYDFWRYLAKAIQGGVTGHYTRATIVNMHISDDSVLLGVRLFCHGEIMSHTWLALFGLSKGLTADMPLQWCIPGKGPVITMTGQPSHSPSVRWLEVRPGIQGYWVAEITRVQPSAI